MTTRLLAVVAACVAAAVAALPSSAQAEPLWGPYNHLDPEFCDSATVRGNPAQLKALPQLPEIPASGELGFAPATVALEAHDPFQVGEADLGFNLRQTDGHRTPPLGLELLATFSRIDRKGSVLEALGDARARVQSLRGFESAPVSVAVTKPGLYRAILSVFDRSGKRLARYGAYTRLLPLRTQPPRLALNDRVLVPGERLLARVENFSEESISYGVPYSIERWDGRAWTRAPESPGGFKKPLYGTPPGGTGPCLPFGIPETMAPGTYRMAKPIRSATGPMRLLARFEIRPAG